MTQTPTQVQKANELLIRRPVLSAVVTVVLLLIVLSSMPASSFDFGTAPGWLTTVVVALIVYGVVMVVLFPRMVRRSAESVGGVLWAFAMAPALIGSASAFLGTPRWIPGAGFEASVAALVAAIRNDQANQMTSGRIPHRPQRR